MTSFDPGLADPQ